MKKRIFSFLTALCLCLTLLPTAARAENNWESWTIFDGTNLNLLDGSYYQQLQCTTRRRCYIGKEDG